ncbi:NAD-binding protein [Clavulina sp. PMI_390]|nr:NAD-binding protein [Clavulina sp. PMI_390]
MSLPKVVLITGCSVGGIGGALCEEYARSGCIVYASDRDINTLENLEPTGDIRKVQLDVTNTTNVDAVVKTIIDAEGRIDILVNNAGVLAVGPVLDVGLNEVKSAFDINLFSILRLTQAVVPYMAASSAPVTKGLVVNMGSITAILPLPWGGIYAATKAAVRSISEVMHMEFAPLGVKVLLVEPGAIKSNISKNYAPRFSLPASSLYQDYKDQIAGRVHVSQKAGATDTRAFARAIVKASGISSSSTATKGSLEWKPQRYLSAGKNSTVIWLMSWLPKSIALHFLWRSVGKPPKSRN